MWNQFARDLFQSINESEFCKNITVPTGNRTCSFGMRKKNSSNINRENFGYLTNRMKKVPIS